MPTDSWKTIVPSSAGYIVHGPKGFACKICLVHTFIISISIPYCLVILLKSGKCVLSVDGIAFYTVWYIIQDVRMCIKH